MTGAKQLSGKFAKTCLSILRQKIFTVENGWAILLSIMIIFLVIMLLGFSTMQPRFVYSGF
jgi:hypothetical protein